MPTTANPYDKDGLFIVKYGQEYWIVRSHFLAGHQATRDIVRAVRDGQASGPAATISAALALRDGILRRGAA